MKKAYVLTCEHAGNQVPWGYESLFEPTKEVLWTHRGWDPGALEIARCISDRLALPLYYTEITRLLVEANRSLNSPQLFSDYTKPLTARQKQVLIDQYWFPYREKAGQYISSQIEKGNQVIHLSVHTFTPVWEGKTRQVEVGLLYDDELRNESEWCLELEKELRMESQDLLVVHNQPYHGKDDGFTTYLRSVYDSEVYLGIEVEVNQKFTGQPLSEMSKQLSEAIGRMILKVG